MRKLLLILIIILFLVVGYAQEAEARLLPRFRNSGKTSYSFPVPSSSGVIVSPKLRGDRQALIVYFSNLQNATSVSYSLTYETNGKTEGVGGTIRPSGENNTNRILLFGTCSGGVCRYHTNIANMRLEVSSKLPSGKTSIKRYRVRL